MSERLRLPFPGD